MTGAEPGSPSLSRLPPRASVARNAAALYALQAANYLIPLVTLPFLVRHLGATAYGQLAYAYAVVFLLVLAVDAGFNVRAARQLACVGMDDALAGRVIVATQLIKLFQVIAAAAVLAAGIALLAPTGAPPELFVASFMTVLGSLFFPVWIFQGLELMHFTTVCSLGGRLLATIGLFAVVRGPDDVLIATLLQASGTFLSGLLALPVILRRLRITWPRRWRDVSGELRSAWREGSVMAVPEYFNQLLSNAGVVVLGWFASMSTVGTYAAVEKLVRAAASAFTPVVQALFPRVAHAYVGAPLQARALARRWSVRIAAAAGIASLSLGVFADPVLWLMFGSEWTAQAIVLTLFAPWIVFSVAGLVVAQLLLLAPGYRVAWTRTLWSAGLVRAAALLIGPAVGATQGLVIAQAVAELFVAALFVHAARRAVETAP